MVVGECPGVVLTLLDGNGGGTGGGGHREVIRIGVSWEGRSWRVMMITVQNFIKGDMEVVFKRFLFYSIFLLFLCIVIPCPGNV